MISNTEIKKIVRPKYLAVAERLRSPAGHKGWDTIGEECPG